MHNTIGDVTLDEKQIISMILCSIQNKSSSSFLSLDMLLACSQTLGIYFSASRSYIKRFFKEKNQCTTEAVLGVLSFDNMLLFFYQHPDPLPLLASL